MLGSGAGAGAGANFALGGHSLLRPRALSEVICGPSASISVYYRVLGMVSDKTSL